MSTPKNTLPPQNNKKTILGIDPGYGRTGWALLTSNGSAHILAEADCIETTSQTPYPERLGIIHQTLTQLILKFKPTALAIESLFFAKNAKTAIQVAQARGVVILAGQQHHIPQFDYTPLQVKQSLIGYGRADKKQIITMLKHHLHTQELPKQDDTCDAIAVALTHAYTNHLLK